ncbi:PTS galactitol transporter subunit IIC [Novibacillus thermophilus]|uniref:PTS galactitol transporter subunit IIC n=1 Tax=Novibacillus thermophilus TaxID=1471761 RepID=A0A1U9K7U9_9BACL|nr:PTS transporter subunit IIC [Novibacillus thermophilus]AQS56137.1 PTS galactitol transporter subunit IIC [Novibacillus thermophilus]
MGVVQYVVDLGPTVVLPILICLFGLLLRQKLGSAIRSGITVGIGFIGINLVIDLLVGNLGPAAQAMVNNLGVNLSVIDVGWPATSAIAFGSTVGALAIPIGLAVNVGMLVLGLTKTLDIDLWNFWHIAFTGALVAILTDSFWMGILTAVVHMMILLILADLTAKHVQDFYGYPNISFPHGTSAPYYLIALPMNKLFDAIPVVRDWKANPESIQKRFGVLGESTIIGLALGLVIGVLAGYDVQQILQLGISTAAVMLLLPRMVSVLMEGLMPVSEAAGEFIKKRFPGREFYIGLDSAIAVGHPSTIASSLLLVPIVLALAVMLPGNRVLPFGDLATIPFIVCLMVPIFRGNVFRTVVTGAVAIGIGLYIATWISPMFTTAAANAKFEFPENATTISSLVDGANPMTWILLMVSKLGALGMIVFGILIIAWAYYMKVRRAQPVK